MARRRILYVLILAAAVAAPVAPASAAQSQPMRIAQAAEPAAKPPVTTRVKVWTQAKWNAAKARWRQDRDKWKQCQSELKGQKLKLHQARHFLADCMARR
jgi:hypothetical protein